MMITNSPVTVFGHKPWSKYDLAKLSLSYKHGYSIKMISRVLKKSMTATNKAITRHGLRDRFGLKKDFISRTTSSSIDNLIRDLKPISDAENLANLTQAANQNECASNPVTELQTKPHYVIADCDLPARIKTEDFLNYVKFTYLLQELRKMRFKVVELRCPHHQRQGYKYLLNDKPASRADILIHLNKQRLQRGLSIFHLDDVTFD